MQLRALVPAVVDLDSGSQSLAPWDSQRFLREMKESEEAEKDFSFGSENI